MHAAGIGQHGAIILQKKFLNSLRTCSNGGREPATAHGQGSNVVGRQSSAKIKERGGVK